MIMYSISEEIPDGRTKGVMEMLGVGYKRAPPNNCSAVVRCSECWKVVCIVAPVDLTTKAFGLTKLPCPSHL